MVGIWWSTDEARSRLASVHFLMEVDMNSAIAKAQEDLVGIFARHCGREVTLPFG